MMAQSIPEMGRKCPTSSQLDKLVTFCCHRYDVAVEWLSFLHHNGTDIEIWQQSARAERWHNRFTKYSKLRDWVRQ